MGDLTSVTPVSRFFALAAAHAERPWLFWGEGWDWRWLPYGRAAAEVERLGGPSSPSVEATLERGAPAAFLRDLARQREAEASTGLGLAALGRAFGGLLPHLSSPAPPPRRETVVVGLPEEIKSSGPCGERAVLSWALTEGAVLVFEPDPAQRAATAIWARSTVFAGPIESIRDLARRFAATKRHRFSRLRAVVALEEAMTASEIAAWGALGIRAENFTGSGA